MMTCFAVLDNSIDNKQLIPRKAKEWVVADSRISPCEGKLSCMVDGVANGKRQ